MTDDNIIPLATGIYHGSSALFGVYSGIRKIRKN